MAAAVSRGDHGAREDIPHLYLGRRIAGLGRAGVFGEQRVGLGVPVVRRRLFSLQSGSEPVRDGEMFLPTLSR